MILNGKHMSEDFRLQMLREEESELGIQPLEYVSNEIISARLVQILPQKAAQTSGQEAPSQVAAPHPHQEPAHSPHIGESGLHELAQFTSFKAVMG